MIMRYETLTTPSGTYPLSIPNTVIEGDGFYVSFNDTDTTIYGCETTALVVGQMEKFFILKGDHRAQYRPLLAQGFDACFAYFEANQADRHKHSHSY